MPDHEPESEREIVVSRAIPVERPARSSASRSATGECVTPRRPLALRSLRGLDPGPEVVEGDAVVERRAVDDLAFAHPRDPGVGVLVRLPIYRDPAAVPDHDHGVAVGEDGADRGGAERFGQGEPSAEGRQDLVDELLRVAVLP